MGWLFGKKTNEVRQMLTVNPEASVKYVVVNTSCFEHVIANTATVVSVFLISALCLCFLLSLDTTSLTYSEYFNQPLSEWSECHSLDLDERSVFKVIG